MIWYKKKQKYCLPITCGRNSLSFYEYPVDGCNICFTLHCVCAFLTSSVTTIPKRTYNACGGPLKRNLLPGSAGAEVRQLRTKTSRVLSTSSDRHRRPAPWANHLWSPYNVCTNYSHVSTMSIVSSCDALFWESSDRVTFSFDKPPHAPFPSVGCWRHTYGVNQRLLPRTRYAIKLRECLSQATNYNSMEPRPSW
jgi:hypothetical protein